MILSSYHKSFLSKILALFDGVTISDLIFITDEDGDFIDNVVFFEVNFNRVVGFYINGANPLITKNHIHDFDDFNLYASYSILNENKQGIPSSFKVEYIKVIFHPDYDEVVAIYLSSFDFSSSAFIVFSTDEIYVRNDCKEYDLINVVKEYLIQYENIDFEVFKKNTNDTQWYKP